MSELYWQRTKRHRQSKIQRRFGRGYAKAAIFSEISEITTTELDRERISYPALPLRMKDALDPANTSKPIGFLTSRPIAKYMWLIPNIKTYSFLLLFGVLSIWKKP